MKITPNTTGRRGDSISMGRVTSRSVDNTAEGGGPRPDRFRRKASSGALSFNDSQSPIMPPLDRQLTHDHEYGTRRNRSLKLVPPLPLVVIPGTPDPGPKETGHWEDSGDFDDDDDEWK